MSKPEQPFDMQPRQAQPAKTKRVADPELQALNKIGDVLNGLDAETLQRVLLWVNGQYAQKEPTP